MVQMASDESANAMISKMSTMRPATAAMAVRVLRRENGCVVLLLLLGLVVLLLLLLG